MVLPIFPAQALDSSVITTVWIGLCVIAFFNLRFGTTVAGLVVPGYLVPLLVLKPASAFVIWGEAIVTYLLARLLADRAMRWTGSSTMFGRDRFFALLLVSVAVRTVFDGWLLPATGRWLAEQGVIFDYHNNLYSFGLVIIALTANQMWNSGLARGIGVFALYVATTYAIVRYLLIPFTNFDISGLGFLYEGLATDILASPKAYLILLCTAFIASRMNLIYGWEFSGILIPALLALQWFQPAKLLVSLLEAAIIWVLGRQALRLHVFRRMNMEGMRLLLLFFTIGYLYKLLLGFVLQWAAPGVKASDFFAFGYLLSTLLAVKMHQKQLTWQISRTTLQTSLMGLAIASAIGYAFALALPPSRPAPRTQAATAVTTPQATRTLPQALVDHKRDFYESEAARTPLLYSGVELEAFGEGIRALARHRARPDPALVDAARFALDRAGFEVDAIDGWLLVRDRTPSRGSGVFAINSRARTPLLVAVPAPLDEPGVFEAAAQLAQADGHAAFASAGTRRDLLPDGRSNVLRSTDTPFAIFHAIIGREGALHVRGRGRDPPSELWIQRDPPPGLDVARLGTRIGPVDTRFGRRDADNPLRDAASAPFAELLMGRPARLRLVARTLGPARVIRVDRHGRVDGFLYAWLVGRRDAIAAAGSGRYRAPDTGDLLYLQAEVLDPLQRLALDWRAGRDDDQLEAINAAASTLGYRLVLHRHVRTGEQHAVLVEAPGGTRHWGTYAFRLGEAAPYVVEIPRPLAERQTFEYGTQLFVRLGGRALLVAGAHPAASPDGRGDVLAPGNPRSVFNLVHQLATTVSAAPPWVLQVRGRRDTGTAPAPDVIAGFVGKPAARAENARLTQVLGALRAEADTVVLAGSGPMARSLEAGADAQSDFSRRLPGARFLTLAVSAQARRSRRDTLDGDADRARYAAVGIATQAVDLRAHLAAARFGAPPADEARTAVDNYVRTRNVVALARAAERAPGIRRLVDLDSGRDYLQLDAPGGGVAAIRDLDPGSARAGWVDARDADAARRFADGDAPWVGAAAR